MIFEYSNLNTVEWYHGDMNDLPDGYWYCDGRSVTSTLYGVVVLPDLTDSYLKSGDWDGIRNNHRTSIANISHVDTTGNHKHGFNITAVNSNNTGNGNSAHNHNRTSNSYSANVSYYSYSTYNQPNRMNNSSNNRWYSSHGTTGSLITGSSTSGGNHGHTFGSSFTTASTTGGGDHNHNITNDFWDDETRPDSVILHPIMFLGHGIVN